MTMSDNRTTERVDHPPRVREAIDELMRKKDATDNRTTELREKLTERGVEYTTNDHLGAYETSWDGFTAMQLTPGAKLMMVFTPEQAIAATLGNSRAERTCKQEERGWGTEGDHARVWLTCGHDCMVPTVQDLPNYCPTCGARVVGRDDE